MFNIFMDFSFKNLKKPKYRLTIETNTNVPFAYLHERFLFWYFPKGSPRKPLRDVVNWAFTLNEIFDFIISGEVNYSFRSNREGANWYIYKSSNDYVEKYFESYEEFYENNVHLLI